MPHLDYEFYFRSFLLGDALGVNIVEDLTDRIVNSWYPGAGFRYADPNTGQILALRSDACTWGITPTEADVAINGIFCGISTGDLTVPDNLVATPLLLLLKTVVVVKTVGCSPDPIVEDRTLMRTNLSTR